MQVSDLRNIHTWVRNTEVSEILFVSALIMPVYLMLYDFAFERIGFQSASTGLALAMLVYAIGIVWMKGSQSRREKNEKDLATITNHIVDQGFRFMSFEQIANIDSRYTESRVRELMFTYPDHLRLGILEGGRRGIKVLNVEE